MKRIVIDARTASSGCGRIAAPALPHWQASLSPLAFERDADATRLTKRAHRGPLRVQKALYPEGPAVCHAIVVHPPCGVVGGDALAVDARCGDDAAALLTTPGAAKWYRANGRVSRQTVTLQAGARASLEWLPQETIFFDDAHVELEHAVALGAGATYIGVEILCFGRTASGESFSSGRIAQRTSIRRDGRLVWFEQGEIVAGGTATTSPLGLAGRTVCATLIAVGKPLPAASIDALRDAAGAGMTDGEAFGATQLKDVVVARYLGGSGEKARQAMTAAWQVLRPALTGRVAVVPRIWHT